MPQGAADPPVRDQGPTTSRQQWMGLLARAPIGLLEAALEPHLQRDPQWLRPPETGLMMVQGRAGGTGERFNLGEVTVTRCALRLSGDTRDSAVVGVAYVLGRNHRQAQLAAAADALLQDPSRRHALEVKLLAPVRRHLARSRAQRQARAQSTRVEFFTLAREAGSGEGEEA